MILFLDSSAVVKLYANETHTDYVAPLVERVILSGGRIAVSKLTRVEVRSAFARKNSKDGKRLSPHLRRVFRKLDEDFASVYLVYSTSDDVMDLAATIPSPAPYGTRLSQGEHYLGFRGAVQLACALIASGRVPEVGGTAAPRGDFLILTFDPDLHRAAVTEGLAHENPDPGLDRGLRFEGFDYDFVRVL